MSADTIAGEMFRQIGERIRAARLERGWTQTELGKKAGGLNKETINRIELGANARLDTLLRVTTALNLHVINAGKWEATTELSTEEEFLVHIWRAITPRQRTAVTSLLTEFRDTAAEKPSTTKLRLKKGRSPA